MDCFAIGPYAVSLYAPAGSSPLPVLYLHASPEQAAHVFRAVKAPCALCALSGMDWSRDLSPWPAPRAFASGPAFAGGAPAYLETLTGRLVPEIEARLPFSVPARGLVGYSLAGLFAAYALYHTNAFSLFASVSGSLWYDGFLDYALSHPLCASPAALYVSLGAKEHRVCDPRLARVKRCTDALTAHWRQFMPVMAESNPGGHFHQPEQRLARAVDCLLSPPQER